MKQYTNISRYHCGFLVVITCFSILNIMDYLTTAQLYQLIGNYEANPYVSYLVENYGFFAFAISKVALVIFLIAFYTFGRTFTAKIKFRVELYYSTIMFGILFMIPLYIVAVLNNLSILLYYTS